MTLTLTQSRDEILGRVQTLVNGITSQDRPTVIYDDALKEIPRGLTDKWMRVAMIHTGGNQSTLANDRGTKRFTNTGNLVVQIFTPAGQGQRLSDTIASTIVNGFRGYASPGGVWFRNARPEEIGTSGAWYQINVRVFYQYDQLQ